MLVLASTASAQTAGAPYFPERFDWQRRTPQQAGFDEGKRSCRRRAMDRS
jgi:hypothetical protein